MINRTIVRTAVVAAAALVLTDVTGATTLALSHDTSDIENSDVFSGSYSPDGGPLTLLFDGETNGAISQDYTLEDGDTFTSSDTMIVNGSSRSNELLNYSNMISGTGSLLSVFLTGSANRETEAIAFQNLIISAEDTMTVSEPTVLILFGLGLGLAGFARRR